MTYTAGFEATLQKFFKDIKPVSHRDSSLLSSTEFGHCEYPLHSSTSLRVRFPFKDRFCGTGGDVMYMLCGVDQGSVKTIMDRVKVRS